MPARTRDVWLVAVVVAGAVLGVVLRAWLVASPLGPPDADEAVVGLMARHLLDGEVRAFFWGQAYGGIHEAAQVSLLLAAGVPVRAAMELVPILLGAAAALLTWRVGRRLLDPPGGVLAGVLVWSAPAVFVWQTTKERGFYGATIVAGLVLVLLALRLVERPSVPVAAGLGLAAGTGWYANPQILFYAVPAGVWLAVTAFRERGRAVEPGGGATLGSRLVRLLPVGAVTALLGALPWIWSNARTGFASLTKSDVPPTTFLERFDLFFRSGLPKLLSIRTPHRIYWPWGPVSKAVYLLVVVLLVVACIRLPRRAWMVPLAIGLYPLIFAALPTSWYVSEPRYLYCLVPWLALATGGALARLWSRRRGKAVATAALATVAVLTVVSTGALVNVGRTVGALWDFAAGDLDPLVAALEREDADRLFADYWVAQRITLATDERIVAAPLNNVRYPPHEETVRRDPAPAYVVFPDSCYDRYLRLYLATKGIAHSRSIHSGIYALYVPERRVLPEDVLIDWATVRGQADIYLC